MSSMIDVTTEQLMRYTGMALKMRSNMLITGSFGIGKSQIFEAVAAANGFESMVLQPSISDPTDFKGIPFVVDGKGKFILDDHLAKLLTATSPLAVLIDDLGQAPGAVQAACMQLIEARRLNGHSISEHVSFVAATNRRRDASGVGGLFEALKTRFCPILNFEPDHESWIQWGMDNGIPVELLMFIRFRPGLLNNPQPSKEIVNSACPRTIAAVGRWMNNGITDAPIIAGCCGDAWAAEFLAFLKVWNKLPSMNKIISDPNGAIVPGYDEPSVLYALSGAISKSMSEDNASQLMQYVNRLPIEFATMIVKDATRRNENLSETRAINEWQLKNMKIL